MATLAACATGNFTTAATWALVSSASYQGAETGSDVLSTAYSSTRSSAFTPGAITIDGIGVKLSVRTGTTGTISVNLELDSGDTQVAGTEVTINCSDLPAATTVALNGGWIFFKFATPVLLIAATAYQVASKTSNTSQVSLFRDGTTDNTSRYLRTTTTQAPAAGDDLIITKEWTAAATGTDLAVTMDQTAATDYGSAPTAANGLLTPGVAICQGGTLTFNSGSAANPYLKLSNSLIVYIAGTINIGTTGTPIPRDSVAILELDPAADGDYGLLFRNGSTGNIQGLSRTSGKNIVSCKLNTDEAANSTSLGVDADTGWLDNDQIAVASTTRTASQSEVGTLNGAAGASSLTVDGFAGTAGGLLNAHSGTSPTQAEVICLTRNVKVRSATSTLMTYVFVDTTAAVDIDWAEFYYLGVVTTNKRGIEVLTTTGSFNMQFSSIHDCENCGLFITGSAANNITFSSNVMWNLSTASGTACQVALATSGTTVIDSNILIKSTVGGWLLSDLGGTFTNNTVAGSATGISFSENVYTSGVPIGTISGNVSHSNSAVGFSLGLSSSALLGTLGTMTAWRNSSYGIQIFDVVDLVIDTPILFGNTTANLRLEGPIESLHILSPVFNGDTTFATTNGLSTNFSAGSFAFIVDDGDFSTVSGIKTAHTNDINIAASGTRQNLRGILRNTKLGATTEVASQTLISSYGFISAEKLDQTAGNHKTWMRLGTLNTDAVTFNTAAPSMQMTPNNASDKLESASRFQGMKVAVASGETCTISVYVRKSATYNGNQPRLIQKANPALGQNSDVVIDTMTVAVSNWEQLTGTSSTASGDDGVWEFVVDCDGTVGSVNVDDFSAS